MVIFDAEFSRRLVTVAQSWHRVFGSRNGHRVSDLGRVGSRRGSKTLTRYQFCRSGRPEMSNWRRADYKRPFDVGRQRQSIIVGWAPPDHCSTSSSSSIGGGGGGPDRIKLVLFMAADRPTDRPNERHARFGKNCHSRDHICSLTTSMSASAAVAAAAIFSSLLRQSDRRNPFQW